MNYNIFILFFALVLLGATSCASRRNRQNEQRTRTERHILHDSAQHRIRTNATTVDSVATKEIRAVERREIRHISWRWLAAALTLVVFVGFLIRRLFR